MARQCVVQWVVSVVVGVLVTSDCTVATGVNQFTEMWFTTQVDHFSFANNDVFSLRYLVNDSWWSSDGGPIFFYTGNEGNIELFWNNTGFPFDIAAEFGALVVFAEHRYYGKSRPYATAPLTDPSKAGYLTSEQALADFADLLTFIRSHRAGAANSAVVAFGGSYGGMLAAWMRLKYPHIVQGSIAASAPILQFTGLTPCLAFGRVVTQTFRTAGAGCDQAIRRSWSPLRRALKSEERRKWLSNAWRLCRPLSGSPEQESGVIDWLTNIYTNLAMVDYPYPSNFLSPLPAFPVKAACSRLSGNSSSSSSSSSSTDSSDNELLMGVFRVLELYFNYTGSVSCLDTGSQGTDSLDDSGWDFQACTEMVMPMCSDGVDDMFEPAPWNMTSYRQQCRAKYQIEPRPLMAPLLYGGRNISAASNIVFSNGLLDPWSSGGVMHNLSDSLVAVVIPNGAHHLDLRSSNPDDPEDVVEARRIERFHIKQWISEYSSKDETDSEMRFDVTKKEMPSLDRLAPHIAVI